MNDTPTPRTDANEYNEYQPNVYIEDIKVVNSALSRELERELTAAREGWHNEITKGLAELRKAESLYTKSQERAEKAEEQRDGLHELHNKNAARSKELLELCVTLRKQRDRLAEALQKLADCDWVITPRDRMDGVRAIAREALAAVKGGSDE